METAKNSKKFTMIAKQENSSAETEPAMEAKPAQAVKLTAVHVAPAVAAVEVTLAEEAELQALQ